MEWKELSEVSRLYQLGLIPDHERSRRSFAIRTKYQNLTTSALCKNTNVLGQTDTPKKNPIERSDEKNVNPTRIE